MAPKKLLFDARGITPKPCGVRNVAENYLRELSQNYDVIALVAAEARNLVNPSINRKIAPRWASRFNPASDIWVSFQVLKYRPDIFFSAHSFLPLFAVLPKQRVFICHDLFASFDKDFFHKRGLLAPLARLFFRFMSEVSFFRASLVIAPSEAILGSFRKLWINPKRALVVHNGINAPANPPSDLLRRNLILYVGNFRSYKGFDTLFEAWKMVAASPEASNWTLEVVTNEPNTSIQRLIDEKGTVDRLNFHSRIDDARLDELRGQAKIAIVPSREEGFGIPLLEAISAGGFVIHSDIPVFREIVTKLAPDAMTTFPPGNAAKLAEALLGALGSDDIGRARFETNSAQIKQIFSWQTSADTLTSELG